MPIRTSVSVYSRGIGWEVSLMVAPFVQQRNPNGIWWYDVTLTLRRTAAGSYLTRCETTGRGVRGCDNHA